MSVVGSNDRLAGPTDIDGTLSADSELPGRCGAIYGPDSFARYRGGVAVGERTGHLASPNFCGVRLRWSTPPALNVRQDPRNRLSNLFHLLRSLLLHALKHGASDVGKIRNSRGEPRNV